MILAKYYDRRTDDKIQDCSFGLIVGIFKFLESQTSSEILLGSPNYKNNQLMLHVLTPIFLLFPFLFSLTLSDNTVAILCQPCPSSTTPPSLCFTFTGGPFPSSSVYIYPTNHSCIDTGDFPYTYTFTCKSKCKDCMIGLQGFGQMPGDYCSESGAGSILLEGLDKMYWLVEEEMQGVKYDWCQCGGGGLGGWEIAGIVAAGLLGVGLLVLGVGYLYRRRRRYKLDDIAGSIDRNMRKSIISNGNSNRSK